MLYTLSSYLEFVSVVNDTTYLLWEEGESFIDYDYFIALDYNEEEDLQLIIAARFHVAKIWEVESGKHIVKMLVKNSM